MFWSCGEISNVRCWLQVMYDATGVRLHAGRQAEVGFFSSPSFVFQPLRSSFFLFLCLSFLALSRVESFRSIGFNFQVLVVLVFNIY